MSLFGRKAEPKLDRHDDEHGHGHGNKRYGIDDAIQLMRTLPLNQNLELVLLVVRNTLASIHVDLREVIDDGGAKQERLRKEIASAEAAIAELEREVGIKKHDLAALNTDLDETTSVRERLELAAKHVELGHSGAPPASTTQARAPKPPPPPQALAANGERSTMEIEPEEGSTPPPAP